MVVHGRSPQQVAALARKAWLALAATPVIYIAVTAMGEVLFAATGNQEGELLPYGQRVLLTLVLLPVTLAAPVLAARWGHQAFTSGNRKARVPGIAGVVIALGLGVTLLATLIKQ